MMQISDSGHKIAVIGARIPSLICAASLAESGFSVDIYSPRPAERYFPQPAPGICAATDPRNEGDLPELHFIDSINAAGARADESFIRSMCEKAPDYIDLLDRLGVPFNRTMDGRIDFALDSGGKYHRMAHAGDDTGRYIHRVFCDQARRWEAHGVITRHDGMEVFDFIIDNGECIGIVTLDLKSMQLTAESFDAVIIAVDGPLALFGETSFVADDFAPMLAAFAAGAKWMDAHSFIFEDIEEQPAATEVIVEQPASDETAPPETTTDALEITPVRIEYPYYHKPFAKRHIGGLAIDANNLTSIPRIFAAGGCAFLGEGENILPGNEYLFDIHSGFLCADGVRDFLDTRQPLPTLQDDIALVEVEKATARFVTVTKAVKDPPDAFDRENSSYPFRRALCATMQSCAGPRRDAASLADAEKHMRDVIRPWHMKIFPRDMSDYANPEYLMFHRFGLSLSACDVILRSAMESLDASGNGERVVSRWGEDGLKITRE